MRNIVRRSVAVTLLIGVAAGGAAAQVSAAAAPAKDTTGFRSNILPTVEITAFLAALSVYNRIVYRNDMQDGIRVYSATFKSTWDHLRKQTWVLDQDPFNVNQFGHPYMGGVMYSLARSSGHNFWTSLVHANIGSFVWKMAGETDPPSIDDMLTTGQAGSLLGEALYRMADLVLKDGVGPKPNLVHEYTAALISPAGGLNRRIFGDRFKAWLPNTPPAVFWQFKFGATVDAFARDYSAPLTLLRQDATAEISMSYGLPGLPGYDYTRPLDYFDFRATLLPSTKSNFIESVMLRGLLVGSKTAETEKSRGIWGLYGTYDYISPRLFRVSSTALSLGTTRQQWVTPGLALQGSLLGGIGYGAAGSTTIIPSTPTNAAIRDYHYGVTPQALGALRLIIGDRAMLDMTAREYYVSGVGSDDKHGSETIFRANFGTTVRVHGGHAVTVQFVSSARNAAYGKLPDKKSSEETIMVAYSILGGNGFSAVKW